MRRTKAEADQTRHGVILAAERVFYAKGVLNSTLDDVAHEAGVTRGAIYWHFANKTELFLALYDSVPLPQEDMLNDAVDRDGTEVLQAVEAAACHWLELLAGDEQRQRMFTILLRCDYTEELLTVLEKQQAMDDHHASQLERGFAKARQSGALSAAWTPFTASRSVSWLIKGMCADWLLFGKRFDLAVDGVNSVRALFQTFRPATA